MTKLYCVLLNLRIFCSLHRLSLTFKQSSQENLWESYSRICTLQMPCLSPKHRDMLVKYKVPKVITYVHIYSDYVVNNKLKLFYSPDKTEAAVWQRARWETTKAELELAVDVGKNKREVLNWIAGNNNTVSTIWQCRQFWHKSQLKANKLMHKLITRIQTA